MLKRLSGTIYQLRSLHPRRFFVSLVLAAVLVLGTGGTVLYMSVAQRDSQETTPTQATKHDNQTAADQQVNTTAPSATAAQTGAQQSTPAANNAGSGTQVANPTGSNSTTGNTTPSKPGSSQSPSATGCPGAAFQPDGLDPWGGCWPGASTTGIPAGTVLSAYTGPCTISTAGTVIDAKTVNCILSVRAANVTITRSQINGGVDIPSSAPAEASFTITDSNIHIGDNLNTGLMRRNFTANRVEITGGRRSVYCMSNCVIENSWVHAQGGDPDGEAHFSGIRMEQYTTVRHSSITCEANRHAASGCSAGLTGYGDFAAVQNNLIERNLFYGGSGGASTTCAYGGSSGDDGGKPYGHLAENIRFISNRFVRGPSGHCGNLRTVIDFNPVRPGNVWSDNLFNDGTAVNATGP